MASEKSKLSRLIVDESKVDQDALFDTLHEYVQIGSESGRLRFREPYFDLRSKEKIVVVLLGQLAKCELDLADSESLTPTQISEIGDIKKGTVDPGVRDLYGEGIIESEDGQYSVARFKIAQASSFVNPTINAWLTSKNFDKKLVISGSVSRIWRNGFKQADLQ